MKKVMENEIKWATIIPLIGGMAVGNEQTFGRPPEWAVSFEGYENNNASFKNYWPDVPFITLPNDSNIPDISHLPKVDVVSTVCPCAGLSMLNCAVDKSSKKARGCGAVQNGWMYTTAEIILDQLMPRVFWGENAPGLFTRSGTEVREWLHQIARDYGYSLSFVKTDTFLHGLPQHRHRTFYFFWDSDTPPILEYEHKEPINLDEYLVEIPDGSLQHDIEIRPELVNDPSFKFVRETLGKNWRTVFEDNGWLSAWHYIVDRDIFHIFNQFLLTLDQDDRKVQKYQRRSEDIQYKLSIGKGYWNDSMMYFGRRSINAVIMKNVAMAVHPTYDRSFTLRELMWMMGHPHDFKLVGGKKRVNTIFQNVPATTAAYWSSQVAKYIRGEHSIYANTDLVMQSNHKKKIL